MNTRAHGLQLGLVTTIAAGAVGMACSGSGSDTGLSELSAKNAEQAVTLPGSVPCTSTPPKVCWQPIVPIGSTPLTWQWQLSVPLSVPVDTSHLLDVYNIDLVDNSKDVVTALHAAGKKVICYISAGTWENWRPDAKAFPNSVKGRTNGWPGEQWLDIRDKGVLEIMKKRIATCANNGFDGVEPDNVDGYTNSTGFPLTAADQLAYNINLANAAHRNGLSVALKNDIEQVGQLSKYFDYAVNEQCFQYSECNDGDNSLVTNFRNQRKPVFHVEYKLALDRFCPQAKSWGFSSMKKRTSLDAWRQPCP